MNKNLTFRNISNKSTKAFRGGNAQEQEQFELNLQLHAGVSNPCTFKITKNYKASADTKAAIPPYTEKSWTTPGTYTWTVPAGVTKVRVAVCGGGGGGVRNKGTAGNGSTSSFGSLLQATGGTGGRIIIVNEGDIDNEYEDRYAGKGGTPNGRAGREDVGSGTISGGTGFNLSFTLTNGSYGQGGSANGSARTHKASG